MRFDNVTAIIATEDENFETHNGVVPKAVLRATLGSVKLELVHPAGARPFNSAATAGAVGRCYLTLKGRQ